MRKVFGTGFYWVRGYFNYGALNCSCTSDETWSYCVLYIIHVYTLYDTKFYMFTFQCGIMSLYIKRFSYIFIVWEEDVYWLWACCQWMRRISVNAYMYDRLKCRRERTLGICYIVTILHFHYQLATWFHTKAG